jgi:hypothetical protein
MATGKDGPGAGVLNGNAKATVTNAGLTRKQIRPTRASRTDWGAARQRAGAEFINNHFFPAFPLNSNK